MPDSSHHGVSGVGFHKTLLTHASTGRLSRSRRAVAGRMRNIRVSYNAGFQTLVLQGSAELLTLY